MALPRHDATGGNSPGTSRAPRTTSPLLPHTWPPQMRWLFALTLLFVVAWPLPAIRFFHTPEQYVPLHTGLEFVSIAVSTMVFALAWNLRRQKDNAQAMLLGTGFFAVCLIDVAHTLSFNGMPDLITHNTTEKAIDFWLAGRAIAALLLLAVARMPRATWTMATSRVVFSSAVGMVVVVWAALIVTPNWMPQTFIAGLGLTPFKIGAEFVLSGIYALAAVLLLRRAHRSRDDDLAWLGAASGVMALAELFFTLYLDTSDVFSLLGHIYKALAYWMVYRALFVSGVNAPYAALGVEHSRLQTLVDTIPNLVWLKDDHGVYLSCNPAFADFFGFDRDAIIGTTDHQLFPAHLADMFRADDRRAMASDTPITREEWVTTEGRPASLIETTKSPMRGPDGRLIGVLGVAHDITERTRNEQALREANQFSSQVISGVQLGVIVYGTDMRYQVWNPFMESLTGMPAAQVIGRYPTEVFPFVARTGVIDHIQRALRGEFPGPIEYPFEVPQTGQAGWSSNTSVPLRNAAGQIVGVIATIIDITARKRSEEELRLAASIFQASGAPIVVTDARNRIIAANPAFIDMTGYALPDLLDKTPMMFRSDHHDTAFYQDLWKRLNTEGHWHGEIWIKDRHGNLLANMVTINALLQESGEVQRYVWLCSDITEKKKAEEAIWRHAHFDSLTELPNRRLFLNRLARDMAAADRSGQALAVLFIDLDHFKEINDSRGHELGDRLLRETAQRITACVRQSDTVSRLGGDEFTVIMPNVSDRSLVDHRAQEILLALQQPFVLEGEAEFVSASIGITLYPNDAGEIESLLKNADQAMYEAKDGGRNRYSYFAPAMQEIAQARQHLIRDLRGALSGGQLAVHYQPIVSLASGRVCKAEALLRWRHPQLGMVSPVRFIPLAEETGLIHEIGDWVFREAARVAKHWRQTQGHAGPIQISVNKSPRQFASGNTDTAWISHLAEIGLPAECMALEITEGLLLDSRIEVTRKLSSFREAGMQISLDDFGTGYSAMSYLKRFPIDTLKIDKSFVRDMATDPGDQAIVEAIIVMAHKLGLNVVAEGVETQEQRIRLIAAGCDYGQGYLFSRPLPETEFQALLEKGVVV